MNVSRSLLKNVALLINKYDELNFTIPIKEKYTSIEINFYLKKINELLEEKIIYKIKENDVKTIKFFYTKGDKPEILDNINKINNIISNEENKIKKIVIHSSNNKLYTKQELKKDIISFIDDNIDNVLLMHNLYNLMLNGSSFCNSKYDMLIKDLNKIKNNFEDIKKYFVDVKKSLDNSVYGHENAKKEIEKIIGQWINGENTGYCFGFEGCPGVGKTSLAKKGISHCLKDENGESRPFAFIKMGGDSNGSTLHGHNYTYVGSTWGSIVQILMDTQVMNPIIYIDEVDKISKTENGKELIGILTHLLDFTQNDSFQDKYFNGININLSKVLFILSYNDPNSIDRVLLDRIHRIKFNHLSLNDKLTIVKKHLLPEILINMGLDGMIHLDEDVIIYLIETYTIEPGVRKLKEILFDIVGEINLHIFKDTFLVESFPIYLGINDIKKYMKDKFEMVPQKIETENKINEFLLTVPNPIVHENEGYDFWIIIYNLLVSKFVVNCEFGSKNITFNDKIFSIPKDILFSQLNLKLNHILNQNLPVQNYYEIFKENEEYFVKQIMNNVYSIDCIFRGMTHYLEELDNFSKPVKDLILMHIILNNKYIVEDFGRVRNKKYLVELTVRL
jgi:ATP-dependent Lon protease